MATVAQASPPRQAEEDEQPVSDLALEQNGTDWTRSLDNWGRCYEGYRVGTDPALDVHRLGLLCGPSNGMRRKRQATEGDLVPARESVRFREDVKSGECLRWVTVAQPSVAQLAVIIRDASGTPLHRFQRPVGRWRVAPPLEPWCASQAGVVEVEIQSQGGAGRFWIETWSAR